MERKRVERRSQIDARWRPALMAFFLRRVRNHAEAEDLTQEVFVRMVDRNVDGSADHYVFQIAQNLLVDRARRDAVRRRYREGIGALDNSGEAAFDPEREALGRAELVQFAAALQALPERTRVIFTLYRIDQMSQDVIGEAFGISKKCGEEADRVGDGLDHGPHAGGRVMSLDTRACDTRDEEAALWCLSLAEGDLDHREQQTFDQWLRDEDNAVALEDAMRVWAAAGRAADLPEVLHLRTQALARLQAAQRKRWRRRITAPWLTGAVAGLACLVLALVVFAQTSSKVYRTDVGERQVAMLSDGSRLSLDADTEVRVRINGDRRDLTLVQGRAKFDVARDPLRPFAVTAGGKVVVATGTSFSVELLNREARVLLYEGHVAVMDREATIRRGRDRSAPPPFAGLVPGRELVVNLDAPIGAPRLQAVDPARSLSWEGGQLNFDDEPLSSAVERINRYSRTKVRLENPALGSLTVNGVFAADDVDAFLEAVTVFNAVEAVEHDGMVTLRPS